MQFSTILHSLNDPDLHLKPQVCKKLNFCNRSVLELLVEAKTFAGIHYVDKRTGKNDGEYGSS